MADKASGKSRLDIEVIRGALSVNILELIGRLDIFECVESTNDYMLALAEESSNDYMLCIANKQNSGRGRNGKVWQSPANSNIYMTLGSRFEIASISGLGGLSLACGVAVARMLEKMGLTPQVKWPNDILLAEGKIAGILVETRIRADHVFVVIGIGLNVNMSAHSAEKIDRPWADMRGTSSATTHVMERNAIIAKLIDALIKCCAEYKRSCFDTFAGDWRRFDALSGRSVVVETDDGEMDARVIGITQNYALQVEIDGKEKRLYAADVKLKMKNNVND